MAEADKIHMEKKLKKRILPRGTSEYQASYCIFCYSLCFDNSNPDNGLWLNLAVSYSQIMNLQAAWIVDDSDVDNSDVENSNSDVDADDDMVLDERNTSGHGQDMLENYDDDDDNKTFVSFNDRESDQESEVDSVMMVSLQYL